MATTAAILETIVRANTSAATRDLRQYDSYLKRVDKSSVTTTARSRTLGRATGAVGSQMRSAARYAVGAAAAYVSIAQAKAAVTTTQDLAKTTAGLNRNLGLTVKEGSRWAAEAKSRDIDAKSLTMSFTTLSRRVVDTSAALKEGGSAAQTAMAPFKRLGISQQEVVRGSKDLDAFLPRLADAFGNAAGGAERQASAQQLLGRGYATILPLFAQGAEGLKEQQMWADKYGTTLNEKTLKAQMDLVQAQRESKVAWVGIQMTFARFVTPALQEANKQFQEIAAIMADDKLTDTQKWQRVGKIVSGWADAAFDAFTTVLPKMVAAAGQRAPEIAKALVEGFANADVWGKAALAGVLIWKMLGGVGAVTSAAAAAGATLGTRVAIGFKAALARTGIGLAIVGLFEALTTEGGIIDTIQGKGNSIGEGFVDGIEAGIGGQLEKAVNRKSIPLLQKHVDHVNALIKVYEDAGDEVPADLRKMANAGQRELDKMNASVAEAKEGIHRLRVGFHDDLGSIMQDTDRNMDLIRNSMDINSKRGRAAVDRNFSAAVTAIERAMDQGLIAAGEGYRAIAALARKELGNYGIKGADAEKIILATQTDPNRHGHHGLQTGGVVPGSGSGDRVPLHIGGRLAAMVESGEYVSVANRNATAALMQANAAIPRFQAGGMVDPAGPGTGVVNEAIAAVVGNWSRQYNAAINYGYDPGGGHQSPGHNITGTATDTGPAGGWAGESLALFERGLRAIEGKVPQILYGTAGIGTPYPNHGRGNHAHIEWGMHPNISGMGGVAGIGPVKIELPRFEGTTIIGSIAAAGLNRVAGGVEQVLAERVRAQSAAAGRASTGAAISGDGNVERVFAQVAKKLSTSKTATLALGMAGFAESGMRDLSYGDASSQGALQLLASTASGLGINPHDEGAIASHFLLRGYWGGGPKGNQGANAYAADGYPAHLVAQYVQGSATADGSNYAAQRGPAQAWMQRFGLKEGGIVQKLQEGGKILLVGDSITKMALDAGGFPGGWDHPGTVVGGKPAHGWGDAQVAAHWGDSDYAALAFMMGTNDATAGGNLAPALKKVKGVIKKAGLALMTFPSGSTDQGAKNRLVQGFGADALASMSGIPLSDGLHPTSPEGISAFRQRIKEAGNAAKKAMKGGGSGGGGGEDEAGYPSDLSAAGMSFGEWVQSILGDGSKGTQGLSDRVRKAIKQTTDNITLWDAVIGGQEIRDAMSYSEAGSELGPGERANQILMNENLLMTLKAMKAWILEGLKTPRLKATARARLEELLEGVQGVRGSKTGRLLDVEAHLDELRNPDTSGSAEAENNAAQVELLAGLLRDEKLRGAVLTAQYDVFKNFAGGFAAGGFIGAGQWGVVGEAGPEVVGGPMAVSPMGGTTVIVNGDIVNTPAGKQPVEVQGAKAIVQQGSRGMGRRPLGSARGY